VCVKGLINVLGEIESVLKVKFYFHLLHGASSLISDLFCLYFNDCYLKDDCFRYIFQSKHAAINDIYMNSSVLPANDCYSILILKTAVYP